MTFKKNYFDHLVYQFLSLKKYHLIKKVSKGDCCESFLVFDFFYKKNVVIKISKLRASYKERVLQVLQFDNEYTLLSELSHPGIVKILGYGYIGDKLIYQVFEWVDGVSLDVYIIKNSPLSASVVYGIMTSILKSLVYIHENNVIHQDIKPSNIILSKKKSKIMTTIIDFGISRKINDFRAMCDWVSGTPNYCPPDQLQGTPSNFGNDLYMWALVYLECLSGVPLLSNIIALDKSKNKEQELAIDLPQEILNHPLGKLLSKALINNPNRRFNNSKLLMFQLRHIDNLELPCQRLLDLNAAIDKKPTQIIFDIQYRTEN